MPSSRLVLPALLSLLLLGTACLQTNPASVAHGTLPGKVRIVEERPGHGARVIPGDRIRVDLVGRYASGEVWGEGPLTLLVGAETYPGLREPLRVGATIRLEQLSSPFEATVRLEPFVGEDSENEAYQVRRDRGPVLIEHHIRQACRPMELFVMNTGLGAIETSLGCWPIPWALPRGSTPLNSTAAGPLDPPPAAVPPAVDTSRYLDPNGVHRATREGRPALAGWLLARGLPVEAVDSFGFLPIHYAGWAQRVIERYLPAMEQSYLDVVDTLVAHGALVDAPVRPGAALAPTLVEREYEGQTALGFAAAECADKLVEHLLDLGAKPDARAAIGSPALMGAARNGCPETVAMLLSAGASVDWDPQGGGTALERLVAVSAFHQGHLEVARLLIGAKARTSAARERLSARLEDPGPGSFGFSNRPMARRILALLR